MIRKELKVEGHNSEDREGEGLPVLATDVTLASVSGLNVDERQVLHIEWQYGTDETNGLRMEEVLEIVADRLRSFQKTPYGSRENALAITAIEEAQNWLMRRQVNLGARLVRE